MMQSNHSWAKALEISDEQLSMVEQNLEPGETVLMKALCTGLANENSYLAWAANHYELSRVDAGFFTGTLPLENIEKISAGPLSWSHQLCPIYVWEDVTYIGCLEPPEHPLPENYLAVLCPATCLDSHWKKVGQVTADPVPEMPETHVAPETPPPQQEPSPAFKLDLSGVSIPAVNDSSAIMESTVTATNTSAVPSPPTMEEPSSSDNESSNLDFSGLTPIPKAGAESPASATSQPPAPAQSAPAPIDFQKSVEAMGDWSEALFAQLNEYYEAKMIISGIDEGFAPTHWSDHWQPKSKSFPFIDINTANIFKIAHQTQKPFHGPISPNEINDIFFEFWKGGEYPPSITIQPIVSANQVTGMIVGIPRDDQDQHKKLRLIQELSYNASSYMNQSAA